VSGVEALILGFKPVEFYTLIGIVTGPIIAVGINLIFESRRKLRDMRSQTMRMLVSTRHLAADPAYMTAINMIPIDFNTNRKVMSAWYAYMEVVRYPAPAGSEADKADDMRSKQTTLIFEILKCLGYNLSETDIQATAYAADGFVRRDNLMIDGWLAWQRIAAALEYQNAHLINPSQSDDPK
jgi:hypothetical protein